MFKENFIRLCNKIGKSPTAVCKDLDLSNSVYTQWTETSVPRKATLMKIADYFNVPVETLIKDNNENELLPKSKKGVLIPVLGRVVAGIPIDAIEEILDYEEITQEMANSGEFFALKIKGDSMMPRIQENDVVIVRKQSQVDNGSIAIVLINGNEATCKKVQYNEKGVALISYNSSFTPMFYTKEECLTLPVTIIGKVVELRAKF